MESNNTATTETIITTSSSPLRPTFLTVLCILTFIGSGWGIYKGVSGYLSADMSASVVREARSQAEDQLEGKDQPAFLKNMMGNMFNSLSPDNIRKSSIVTLVSSLFTLAGGLLMWGLRRNGFYVYIAGILVSVFAPLAIFGGGLVGLTAGGASAFFGILFIILYGVNVKYMVK